MTRPAIHRLLACVLLLVATAATAQIRVPIPARPDPNAGLDPKVIEPITLTEPKLKSFFDAYNQIQAKNKTALAATDPGNPAAFARGLKFSGDTEKILLKNGFKTLTEFQQVGYNAAMAYSILKEGGKEAVQRRINDSKDRQAQELDKMKSHLTPEQLKALEGQLNASLGVMANVEKVPEGNIELIKKHEAKMAKLGQK
ncbi:MAG TPA: hypothetical protein VEB21_11515 [Terriglobales bacterium]|nr:hypothetical protein [Terriglobales bacterium]